MSSISRRNLLEFAGKAGACSALMGLRGLPAAHAQNASPNEFAFQSATELCRMLRERQISSFELTQYFIDRIERYDGAINCMVVRDFERALEAAERADAAMSRGNLLGPLHGLPMSVKEAYDVAGLATTWGDPAYANNVAAADSAIVASYKSAGAVLLGKTNVPVGLARYQSFNDIYGQTNNPWNLERSPGGSSGGSAAALAAGLTGLDSGTDIGGSVRNPSHCCGVYGHKPTWGIVPQRGYHSPAATGNSTRDLDVLGPLARSADDLNLALDVIAQPEDLNAPGWKLELPPPRANSLRDFKVAVWPSDPLSPPSTVIAERIEEVVAHLVDAGAEVSTTARPGFDSVEAITAYRHLLSSVSVPDPSDTEYAAGRAAFAALEPGDPEFSNVFSRARYADYRSWAQANDYRNGLRRLWQSFFEDWDIVLCPISVITAPPHDHRPDAIRTYDVDGVATPWSNQVFWASLATLSYLPSTAFPTGLAADGLPIGLQAIGSAYSDRTTIQFARLLTMELGGFSAPPGYRNA